MRTSIIDRCAVLSLAAVVAILAGPGQARAGDIEDGGALYAVQNRKYTSAHEFSVEVGSLPMDAFYKGYTVAGAYTLHFDDLWAWEVVNAAWSFNLDTDLRDELESNWAVTPTRFPAIRWLGDSNLVFKPLYGKLAWLNGSLLYGELFFTAGPALASYESDGVLSSSGTYVGANAGLGLRFYLSESWSLRIDARDYYFVSPKDIGSTANELYFSTGIALNVR